ncbi:MAG: cytochrome-c oxidase, cbb3-type subunit III [Rhodomicrobium sp.]|jgi:cytochrome c oxidase cbb3-type subunit 3
MAGNPEIDPHSGLETTGHEWDGIQELNRPLPRWWLWVFYACILWSFGYWVAYPAWPLVSGYSKGVLGWSQRASVAASLEEARASHAKEDTAIGALSLAEIKGRPDLLNFALAGGKAAFGDNCAACHGRGAQGSPGFPNLNDDKWLWGGTLEDIYQTIEYGVRSGNEKAHVSQMPSFGTDKILTPEQIDDAAEYVLSLSKLPHDAAAAERGNVVFHGDGGCLACHGEEGKGNQDFGAPNLTDNIWLYGGTKDAIRHQIEVGHGGVMPAWVERLDPVTIKKLALYVHSLGGGK